MYDLGLAGELVKGTNLIWEECEPTRGEKVGDEWLGRWLGYLDFLSWWLGRWLGRKNTGVCGSAF